MLFSSISFLYYFLPAVLLFYFIVPAKGKNAVLLLFSLLFYGWGEPKYVLLLLGEILLGYFAALAIEKAHLNTEINEKDSRKSAVFLTLAVGICLLLLGYFKYADFFIDNVNRALGISIKNLQIALPIGISFFTFQIISYTVDVYKGEVKAQRNLLDFAMYVSFFPQLIAGPIVRYQDIEKRLKDRKPKWEDLAMGARRFVIGLGKKVLLANGFGELCQVVQQASEKTVLFYWMYAVAFTLQIYFDFSGYSDMAIGLGRVFGFSLLENFNYPYIAGSITEFWRRWHISLGSWFRDYVYIPLGGNRTSKGKWLLNILIVWFLTGFWHGASWNFILWGLMYGLLLLVEKIWLLEKLQKAKVWNHIYVLFFVVIGFAFFNATDLGEAKQVLSGMFALQPISWISLETKYYFRSYLVLFLIGIVGATPLPKWIMQKGQERKLGKTIISVLEIPACIATLLLVSGYLVDGSFNPFLYFRF